MNIGIFIFSVLLLTQAWNYRHIIAIRYLMMLMGAFCLASFFTLNVYTTTSLETKIMFSRLRFLGLAFISPAALLFFSHLLNRWIWLQKKWVSILIFVPAIITAFFTLISPLQDLVVNGHSLIEHWGVSALQFKTGTWFPVYYFWTNIFTFSCLAILLQSAISNKNKRKEIFILSLGVVIGSIIDVYCVVTGSIFRWLMLPVGSFAISQFAIVYVARKNQFFGLLKKEKEDHLKLLEQVDLQKKLLTFLTHDLSGNIQQQVVLTHYLRQQLESNHNEVLETLSNSTQATNDLIGNIMRWLKTQGGQFQVQLRCVELPELINKCTESIKNTYSNRKVNIRHQILGDCRYLVCDFEMIASVIRNLLSNAIKASNDGSEVWIYIEEDKDNIKFSIKDKGIGMSEEQLNSLWTPHLLKRGEGYGFGLILVRHFIELHHGSLQIESISNLGTTVQFSLPFLDQSKISVLS